MYCLIIDLLDEFHSGGFNAVKEEFLNKILLGLRFYGCAILLIVLLTIIIILKSCS